MAKKKNKVRFANDIRVGDSIFLDQPEVKVIKIDKPKAFFRDSPEGYVFHVEDASTKQMALVYKCKDDKVESKLRPGLLERFGNFLDKQYKKHQSRMKQADKKSEDYIPPIFKS